MQSRSVRRILIAVAMLAVGAGLAGIVRSQNPASAAAPGWTGVTNPEDVILARQALMTELERLMRPIDSFTAGDRADPAELGSAAVTIAQILLALPHLFPPTTNLYDPDAELPVTIGLPAIWEDFSTFYALSAASADAAAGMAASSEADDALKVAGANLRATCDACHALFLRPYTPGTVTDEDLEFDFDELFEQIEAERTQQ